MIICKLAVAFGISVLLSALLYRRVREAETELAARQIRVGAER